MPEARGWGRLLGITLEPVLGTELDTPVPVCIDSLCGFEYFPYCNALHLRAHPFGQQPCQKGPKASLAEGRGTPYSITPLHASNCTTTLLGGVYAVND